MNILEDYEFMKLALKGVLKELSEISIALDNIENRIIKEKSIKEI